MRYCYCRVRRRQGGRHYRSVCHRADRSRTYGGPVIRLQQQEAQPRLRLFFRGTTIVPIAVLTLELRIEGARSLKDKRRVLRSLKDKLRAGFNISVAEMDRNDLWQRATLGVAGISGSRDYLAGLMQQVE